MAKQSFRNLVEMTKGHAEAIADEVASVRGSFVFCFSVTGPYSIRGYAYSKDVVRPAYEIVYRPDFKHASVRRSDETGKTHVLAHEHEIAEILTSP